MAHKFIRVGVTCLLLATLGVVAALIAAGGSISVGSGGAEGGVAVILFLLSSVLGFFGTMFFLAGLIGLAVNGGAEEPVRRPVADAVHCPQCGERENKVGSLYCRNCGAQLLTD